MNSDGDVFIDSTEFMMPSSGPRSASDWAASSDRTYYLLVHRTMDTPIGYAIRIHIERMDGAAMPWRELYNVFARVYPDRWAIQVFPPRKQLMDGANKYHLLVFNSDLPEWAGL